MVQGCPCHLNAFKQIPMPFVNDNAFGLPALAPAHPDWSYYTQIFTTEFLNYWSAG